MKTRSQKNLKTQSLHLHQLPLRTKETTQNNTPLGSRTKMTGVKKIPLMTKSTATHAQQEQNRSKENSRIQS